MSELRREGNSGNAADGADDAVMEVWRGGGRAEEKKEGEGEEEEFSVPAGRIVSVAYGLVKQEELEALGVHVQNATINTQRRPAEGGLSDARMGPSSRNILCGTCGEDLKRCPGHTGYIPLPEAVPLQSQAKVLAQVLACVCFNCSQLLLRPSHQSWPLVAALPPGLRRLTVAAEKSVGIRWCGQERQENLTGRVKAELGDSGTECFHPAVRPFLEDPAFLEAVIRRERPCGHRQPLYEVEHITVRTRNPYISREECDALPLPHWWFLPPQKMYDIVHHITDADARWLGFDPEIAHPRHLLLRSLVCPPTILRQAHERHEGDGQWTQDMGTLRLRTVRKMSTKIAEQMARLPDRGESSYYSGQTLVKRGTPYERGKREATVASRLNELRIVIATYMDGDAAATQARRSDQPIRGIGKRGKALSQRLAKKGGTIRGNMSGKRTDESARTVATGNPEMPPSGVGIPEVFSRILGRWVRVQWNNLAELTSVVHNGPRPPAGVTGATAVRLLDGREVDLSVANHRSMVLRPGMWVRRHYAHADLHRAGVPPDLIVGNRQPSLHKHSVLAHHAYPMRGLTAQTNDAYAQGYNLDHDGDEFNMHTVESLPAEADAYGLMRVAQNLRPDKDGSVIVLPVQDHVVGLHLLTEPGRLYTDSAAGRLLLQGHLTLVDLPEPVLSVACGGGGGWQHFWTGAQLFSRLLGTTQLTLERAPATGAAASSPPIPLRQYHEAPHVCLRAGQLLYGQLTKNLFQRLAQTYLQRHCRDEYLVILHRLCQAARQVVTAVGVTYGVYEATARPAHEAEARRTVERAVAWVDGNELIATADHRRQLTEGTRRSLQGSLVRSIREGELETGRRNGALTLAASGSKGTEADLVQITLCMGQQYYQGKPFSVPPRALLRAGGFAERLGFVLRGLWNGPRADEYMMLVTCGREGITQNAQSIPEVGYAERKIMHAANNVRIVKSLAAETSDGNIVMECYADDCAQPSELFRVPLRLLRLGLRDLEAAFRADGGADEEGRPFLEREWAEVHHEWTVLRAAALRSALRVLPSVVRSPFPFEERLRDLVRSAAARSSPPAGRAYCSRRLLETVDRIRTLGMARRGSYMSALLFDWLASVRLRVLPAGTVDRLLDEVCLYYEKARAVVGEMVGTLMTQAIAEPVVQSDLRGFHNPGSFNEVIATLPRTVELINMKRKIAYPRMEVHLHPERLPNTRDAAEWLASQLPAVYLTHLLRGPVEVVSGAAVAAEWRQLALPLPAPGRMRGGGGGGGGGVSSSEEEEEEGPPAPLVLRMRISRRAALRYRLTPARIVLHLQRVPLLGLGPCHCHGHLGGLDGLGCEPKGACTRWRFSLPWAAGTGVDADEWVILCAPNEASACFERAVALQSGKLAMRERPWARRTIYTAVAEYWRTAVLLQGLPGITAARAEEQSYDGTESDAPDAPIVQRTRWVVRTIGSNLLGVFQLPAVDTRRTVSNDIHEIDQVLGTEAALRSYDYELFSVLRNATENFDPSHTRFLACIASFNGSMSPISRNGVIAQQLSTLSRAEFETPRDIFRKACVTGLREPVSSVIDQYLLGVRVNMGSSYVRICRPPSSGADESALSRTEWRRQLADLFSLWRRDPPAVHVSRPAIIEHLALEGRLRVGTTVALPPLLRGPVPAPPPVWSLPAPPPPPPPTPTPTQKPATAEAAALEKVSTLFLNAAGGRLEVRASPFLRVTFGHPAWTGVMRTCGSCGARQPAAYTHCFQCGQPDTPLPACA